VLPGISGETLCPCSVNIGDTSLEFWGGLKYRPFFVFVSAMFRFRQVYSLRTSLCTQISTAKWEDGTSHSKRGTNADASLHADTAPVRLGRNCDR
jgi:hypothetical protein